MNARLLYLFYTLVFAFSFSGVALGRISNDVMTNFWFPDGAVYSSVETNGIVYFGGTFRYVGPYVGRSAFLDTTSGARDDGFPQTDGPILDAVADGSGGWFIGGSFSMVGETPRSGLAHILANKTLDTTWDAAVGPVGGVAALTLAGGNLYIGGEFISVGGQPREKLAAVSAANASLQSWNPSLTGVGLVGASAMAASGNTIYIGGNFRNAAGQARTNLAALDATTGSALSWSPNPSQPITTLLVSGSTVYVGGPFQRISGQNVTNFAALDATSGAVLSWPNDRPNGAVRGMALNAGTLYLAGTFRQLGAVGRVGYGALGVASGNVTAWNPGTDPNPLGAALAIAGSTVYVGGAFLMCGGQQRLRVAAVDATSGNAIAGWNPGANGTIRRLFVAGNRVLASGEFTSIDGAKRNNIAAIDAATGAATAWNANASDGINAIVASSNVIFAAGAYTNIGGQLRYGIAALHPVTGAATSWNPAPTPPGPNGVNSFQTLLLSGDTLYAAGNLIVSNRTNAVALNTASGAVLAWNPFPNTTVNALARGNGVIYAGGGFVRIGGSQMTNLAALDPITGAATAWNPRVDRPVHALAVNGNTVYAGGLFYRIGGQSRTNFGAVDATSGNAINFPEPSYSFAGGGVYALTLLGTNSLLVGGAQFENLGGTVGGRLFELDLTTGTATSWSPGPERPSSYLGTGYIQDIAVGADRVYASGDYSGGFVAYAVLAAAAAPRLTMPFWSSDVFSFRLLGDDAQEYAIEYSDDLGFWQFLQLATPVNGFIDVIDPSAVSSQRAYRAYAP